VSAPPTAVILFPDDWAAYSPTLTRLAARLDGQFVLRAHVLDTGRVDNALLDARIYRRVRVRSWLAQALRKTGLYRIARTLMLARSARQDASRADHVIAVDADGACAARLLGRKFHFLSLEVGRHPLLRRIARDDALSIAIQSRERLDFQFGGAVTAPVFILQNAPDFDPATATPRASRPPDPDTPRFVYLGHAIPLHGLRSMLDLLEAWPGATLTLQGLHPERSLRMIRARYGGLLDSGALTIGSGYLADDELNGFLQNFDLGLCLYELDARHRHDFNYLSSPSGKMFNYFAAGLPVIASNHIGLAPVGEHGAGVQVASNRVDDLRNAARTILASHEAYRQRCFEAAAHYDFGTAADRLIAFIRAGGTPS
jgi:glycosyltransferase involved in cell wall biosynthesis